MARDSILNHVIEISEDYLGPAAGRYIDRQITTHLKKAPDGLTAADLSELSDWLRLSFSMITANTKIVDEYIKRLSMVAEGNTEEALGKKWARR